MFFPERITSINDGDRVLEVGPGALPHPRADVALERVFPSEKERIEQRGDTDVEVDRSNFVLFGGGPFPFKDNAFDYVICSHVIEHVPPDELVEFLSELQRVAARGYVEVPNVFYEWICNAKAHVWFAGWNDGKLALCLKSKAIDSVLAEAFRHFFYKTEPSLVRLFRKYREFFFIGFEWEGGFEVSLVDRIDDLCDAEYLAGLQTLPTIVESVERRLSPGAELLAACRYAFSTTCRRLLGDKAANALKQALFRTR